MIAVCAGCGEPLNDPVSLAVGFDAGCRMILKAEAVQELNLFNMRADYSYTIEDGIVCIVDHDTGRTVTNDAGAVIEDLAAHGVDLEAHPVIYRDTRGVWDRLVVENGRFAGFRSINEYDLAAAIEKVRSQ